MASATLRAPVLRGTGQWPQSVRLHSVNPDFGIFPAQESHKNFPESLQSTAPPWWASPELHLTDPTMGGTSKMHGIPGRSPAKQELW